MKHLSLRWAVVALLTPVLVVVGLLLLGGILPEAVAGGGKGTVEIAFQSRFVDANGQPLTTPIATIFQRFFLNVVSVRLNPSTNPNVSDFDPNWQTIVVPAGVGVTSTNGEITTEFVGTGNFGPNGTSISIGQGRTEIQLDMNALQNLPQVFNSATIPAKTYNQVELVLAPGVQGSAVPVCPTVAPASDGCVNYNAIYTPPAGSSTTIRTTAPINVTSNAVQTVLIQINVNVGPPPTDTPNPNPSKAAVAITPTIQVIGSSQQGSGVPGLAVITGTVSHPSKNQKVVAELSGTNQVVAMAAVKGAGTANGSYSMSLPALATAQGGTLYDLYTTGGGSYAVKSGVLLESDSPSPAPPVNFTISPSPLIKLTGKVLDGCNSGIAVPSATLQLYVPDTTAPNQPTSCTFDSNGNVTAGCVAVATAQTDPTGTFPLPGNTFNVAAFDQVPLKPPGGQPNYAMKVTASGFNGLVEPVTPVGKSLRCEDLNTKNHACDIGLEHGQLTTTVNLAPGETNTTGQPLNVMVMAEDTGTNNIETLGMANIPPGGSSGSTTMNIPDDATGPPPSNVCNGPASTYPCILNPVTAFDVFGQVQDLYFGLPQKATGHSIGVTSAVPGSAGCTAGAATATLGGLSCAGHGSITGFTTTANSNTTVIVSKQNVQLMRTLVAPISSGNGFSFCVPADGTSYTVQSFQAAPNGLPSPNGAPVSTIVPTPSATNSPGCATICTTSGSGPCLLCNGGAPITIVGP